MPMHSFGHFADQQVSMALPSGTPFAYLASHAVMHEAIGSPPPPGTFVVLSVVPVVPLAPPLEADDEDETLPELDSSELPELEDVEPSSPPLGGALLEHAQSTVAKAKSRPGRPINHVNRIAASTLTVAHARRHGCHHLSCTLRRDSRNERTLLVIPHTSMGLWMACEAAAVRVRMWVMTGSEVSSFPRSADTDGRRVRHRVGCLSSASLGEALCRHL